ncbi:MAG: sulfatase-like hydrolase/transferase [Planctomycetota bacterium]
MAPEPAERCRAIAAALALAVLAACGGRERPGVPPEHVLLLTVSGLRADHVTAWMYPRPTTVSEPPPVAGEDLSIDGLAASGVSFAHAFAPSAESGASLAELLTGRADPSAGAPTVVQAFRERGFRTAAFVTGAAAAEPLTRDFETVHRPQGEDPDYGAVRAAATWLREIGEPAGEPLFLWVHLSGPAAPWDPAPLGQDDFVTRFADPDYDGEIDGSSATLARLREPGTALPGLDLTHLVALYDAEIARTAHLLRQLASTMAGRFDLLPRDLLASTVVVVAADRGCELFQHGRAAEDPTSFYDASLHVPLVLRHPPSLTGSRVEASLVELADVAPTLLDWFDLDAADGTTGRSLLGLTDSYAPLAFDRRPLVRRRGDDASVRTARWHLVVRGGATQLFDVQRDPLERVDRAAEHADVVEELRAHLEGGG